MNRHLVMGGRVVTTVEEVIGGYVPHTGFVDAGEWVRVRPVVVAAVSAVGYDSVASAHLAMRVTGRFCAWADDNGVPADAEELFTPDRVEAFIASLKPVSRRSRGTYRSVLRRVARAATTTAPWPPEPRPFGSAVAVQPPYTDAEVAGFWEVAESRPPAIAGTCSRSC